MRNARRLQRILDARASLWRRRLADWVDAREAAEAEVAQRRAVVGPSSPSAYAVWADAEDARAGRLDAALAAHVRACRGVDATLSPLREAASLARSAERLVRHRAVEQIAREAAAEARDREAWDAARRVIEP